MNTPATAPKPAELVMHPIEAKIIQRTNAERARYGLRPLRVDPWLVKSARRHATWMTNSHSLTHTTQQVGENIAMGQQSSAEAVRDWMNSPGHRANILNGGYTRIGAAAYMAPDGTIYWCQQFLR
jgi:uncharacterized protein YkwD